MSHDGSDGMLSGAALDKIMGAAVVQAKKDRRKNRAQDLKFAKESLGRALLRMAELMKEDKAHG